MDRASYKATAKRQLTGKWGALVLMCFLYGIFFYGSNLINIRYGIGDDITIFTLNGFRFQQYLAILFVGLMFSFAFLIVLFPLLHGSLTVGQSKYYIDFVERGDTNLNTLFDGFKNFKSNYKLSFMYNLYLVLWSLLPFMGIVKGYSYALTFYLKAIHPEYSSKECITKSRQYMNGYKGEFFVLDLSYILWLIACVFTLGIGTLWLNPYVGVTKANVYHDMLVANGEIAIAEKSQIGADNSGDGLEGIN